MESAVEGVDPLVGPRGATPQVVERIRWINELYNQFPKSLRHTARFEEPPEEYRRILDAIEAKDAELAGRLMSEHLDNGGRATVRHYTERLST